jgi:hypothetical protein
MKKGGIIVILLLLIVGLSSSSVLSSIPNADTIQTTSSIQKINNDMITITFFDYTAARVIKKDISLTKSEWLDLKKELRNIRTSSTTIEESITAQLQVFKKYNLISNDITYETLLMKSIQKSKTVPKNTHKLFTTPIINNSVFNAMCAIDFELINGTTAVFGLNTFINYIGFDIISFHYGYAVNGIDTKGIIQRSNQPGKYAGVMFGFLGYWLGEKTLPGFYTNVTAAGFTVITGWLPIP